jgi:hypothetical protein
VLRGSYEKSVVCSANNAFDIFDCMDRIFSAYFIQIPMDSLFTLNKERHHQFCVENLVISTVLWMQMYAFFFTMQLFFDFFSAKDFG